MTTTDKNTHKDEILLFGEWKKIIFSNQNPFLTEENTIFLPTYMKFYDKITLIKKVYNLLAEKHFPTLLKQEEQKTDIKALYLKITGTISRWGSFNVKGEMKLSYYLIACPTNVIGYVICHELCHKKQMNHSKEFHKLLKSFYPESKPYENILKKTGTYIRSIK